ncbi:MAG: hypothetical protein ACYCQI_03090 [Gammaproteobacteria bacterium]
MLVVHPDKGGDTELCRQVIEAWNYLSQPSNLTKYYEEFSQRKPLNEAKHSSKTTPASHFMSGKDDALVKYNEKITVFIPLKIPKPKYCGWESIDTDSEYWPSDLTLADRGMFQINPYRLTENLDFKVLAELLTRNLKHDDATFVGLDTTEAEHIVTRHSWNRFNTGYIYIEAKINAADLYPRASERDFAPNMLNAKPGDYFSLKKNTVISFENIIAFHNAHFVNDKYQLGAFYTLQDVPMYVANSQSPYVPKKLADALPQPADSKIEKLAIEEPKPIEKQSPEPDKSSKNTKTSLLASVGGGILFLGMFAAKRLFGGKSVETSNAPRPGVN